MRIQPKLPILWFCALASLVICGGSVPVRAGLLQVQNNPVSFGNLYWGNPTNWDNLNIPRYQLDTPNDGTHNRDINFISIAHDNNYFYVRFNFAQAPAFNGSDFYFWLDTDLNPNTGTRDFSGSGAIGSEYVIVGAAVIQDPSAWNFAGWVNWDQYPGDTSVVARDVIISIDRKMVLPGVEHFNFVYQFYNSTDGVTGDWYPDSADTLTGDYFQYTTTPIPQPVPAASSTRYSQVVVSHNPLAYYRLNEQTSPALDIATNAGSIGAVGNGAYTTGARHPVAGAIPGDTDTAVHFAAVNTNSTDGGVPLIVRWPEAPLVRELWDGVPGGNLDKKGSGTSSIGFDSASAWHVNNGRIMKVSPWFDITSPPGPPYSLGQSGALLADDSDIGNLGSYWDTSAWATRQLAVPAQIHFGSNGDYWITVRIDNGGDTAMGVGLANAGDSSGQFIGVGAMWDNAGGGAANNSVYITDGVLGTDSPYAIRANSAPGLINGAGLIIAHLTTSSTGDGTLQASVLQNGDNVPTDPSSIVWQTTYTFNKTMIADHLLVWLNGNTSGGNGQLDGVRITTSFASMFQGALNVNGSFTVEAWLRPTIEGNAGNAQSPLFNRDPNDTSPNRMGWDFFQRGSGTGYNFRMFNGNAHDKVFDITGGAYSVGAWGHLVAVYDAAASSATLYFNGVLAAQSTTPNGTFLPNCGFPLSIGGYSDASQNPFTGDLDEVALYTNALSAAQVLAHYVNGTNSSHAISYSAQVLADGAVEYLRCGEPAKNVAMNKGTLGALADGIYNLNAGAGYAGPRAPADAGFEKTNTATFFDGADAYVELGNPGGLNLMGTITLEAWVQPGVTPAAPGGFGDIIAHGYDEDFQEMALRIDTSSGTPQYSISTYRQWVGAGVSAAAPTADLGTGSWVYLAGTYDGTNWNIYRNGALLASSPDSAGALTVTNGNWALGARGRWAHMDVLRPGLDRQFLGAIDEAAVYNRALSPSEVLSHYLVGTGAGPILTIAPSANGLTLTWPAGTLQQADEVNGAYTDLTTASSPYNVPLPLGAKKFYRLKL